jgi:hypothetical protein
MIEVLLLTAALAGAVYVLYRMMNQKESPLDLNKDGKVDTADAEVVVEKVKRKTRTKKSTTE